MAPMMVVMLLVMAFLVALLLLGGFYVLSRANRRNETKRKIEDHKPKRDHEHAEEEIYYTVGDDGELVEMDSSIDPFEDDETASTQSLGNS